MHTFRMANTKTVGDIVGYISEVLIEGSWSRNAVVWPDAASADAAGRDLLSRWFVPSDCRVSEVSEEPNRPDWETFTRDGLPPRSVTL